MVLNIANEKDEFYGYHDYPDHINSANMLALKLDDICGFRLGQSKNKMILS